MNLHVIITFPVSALSQVSLLEYRKRQREARRSGGSKIECSSPLSTAPPVDVFPVAVETAPDSTVPVVTLGSRTPQSSEEADTPQQGEKEGGDGQWYVPQSQRVVTFLQFACFCVIVLFSECLSAVGVQGVFNISGTGQRARIPQSPAAQ